MRKVRKIEPTLPLLKQKKKVAAYARISMETERMLHSLSAQVSYYSGFIQRNPDWEYVGVYSDDGISGTRTKKREGFMQLISDCEAGKIDIVLTKSISRFARNTVDLLNVVRHLKRIGVEVRFEKENINSMSGDGEVMLAILASFAQEESLAISDNVKWGIRKRFQKGERNGGIATYGYRWNGDRYILHPEEAKVIQQIFADFLHGKSPQWISKKLAEKGKTTVRDVVFYTEVVRRILRNNIYTGDTILQKTYVADTLSKKQKKNRGELPRYYVENTHEGIIDKATFELAQKELKRREALGPLANQAHSHTCFTRKIQCGLCGKFFLRNEKKNETGGSYVAWLCGTRHKHAECKAKYVPEAKLKEVCAEVLHTDIFNEETFLEQIEKVVVPCQYELVFHFYDGRVVQKHWTSTAHRDWWTKERRAERSRAMKRISTNPGVLFSTQIRCGKCGENFRRCTSYYADGSVDHYWRCLGRPECDSMSIQELIIKEVAAQAIGIPSFEERLYKEQVNYIEVVSNEKMRIYFQNGRNVDVSWKPRIRKPWGKEQEDG